jgi:hypothetical protein
MEMTVTMGSSTDKKALKKYKKKEESFSKLQNDLKLASDNYEKWTEAFDQHQWQYFSSLSNIHHQFNNICVNNFAQMQDTCVEFMKNCSVGFKVPFSKETFENLKKSIVKNQF